MSNPNSQKRWQLWHSKEPCAVHVVPTNDLKEHVERGTWCHCEPRLEAEGDGTIVIHNAYDGREFVETENELP